MFSRYGHLPPTANYLEIAGLCRECVQKLHGGGRSYPTIAAEISRYAEPGRRITGPALKTFMARDTSGRINRSNTTLELVYNYISSQFESLPHDVQGIIQLKWETFFPESSRNEADSSNIKEKFQSSIFKMFCQWAIVSEVDIEKFKNKFVGKYFMFRRSSGSHNEIVKSILTISASPDGDLSGCRLVYRDRGNVDRISEGFIVPIGHNMYCIMQIEDGEGLDIIAMKSPIPQNFQKIYGFCGTLDMNRKIIWAGIVLERADNRWGQEPQRFDETKLECEDAARFQEFGLTKLVGACQSLP